MYREAFNFDGTVSDTVIIREADSAFIPRDPANTDWQAYQAWLAAGNAPNPAPPSAVQKSVTRLQGRLALNAAGLLTKVETAVAAADVPTQIWYADAQNWDRNDPILAQLAAALGLTSDQVDALFVQAAEF